MYLKTYCVHQCDECTAINWINFGDTTDIFGYDPEGYKCWNCGEIEMFDGGVLDDDSILDLVAEKVIKNGENLLKAV